MSLLPHPYVPLCLYRVFLCFFFLSKKIVKYNQEIVERHFGVNFQVVM